MPGSSREPRVPDARLVKGLDPGANTWRVGASRQAAAIPAEAMWSRAAGSSTRLPGRIDPEYAGVWNRAVNELATGETGFVGANVVRWLVAAGDRVRVLVRQTEQPAGAPC